MTYTVEKGMLAPNFKNLIGEKFFGWEVLSLVKVGDNRPTIWLCRHECGTERELRADQLRRASNKYYSECSNAAVQGRKIKQQVATDVNQQVKDLRDLNSKNPDVPNPGHFKPVRVRRKMTDTERGLFEARQHSHWNL